MDTSKLRNNRVTHRTQVPRRLCRIQASLIPVEKWVHIDPLVPLVKMSLSLETCPLMRHLNQPDLSFPKDKLNSRLLGVSWPKHRSNVNMTSNFRLFETKVLRWIRCVEGMIEVAVLILAVFSRNPILDEAESNCIPIPILALKTAFRPITPMTGKRRDVVSPHGQMRTPRLLLIFHQMMSSLCTISLA
jgi:hypothetical protein